MTNTDKTINGENGTIYLMNRQGMADGESIVLHYTPSQLVGQYFEVV